MENEKKQELAKRETPPSFIEKLMLNSESLEQVKEVGNIIIKSGFCPDHFKAGQGDPVGVVMCIEAGRQLGLTWMQSLSDMYPVKGRIGIMGAGARSLIFSSGVLDKWEESTQGEFPNDSYTHIVISKRKGLPGEFRTEFSVMDAKKAGLMSKDIYQRYGKRMLMWRAIGFHATDYYGDIMKGMKTVEELNDFDVIPGLGDTIIEKEDGTKINIKGGAKGRSDKITERVTDKIPENKFAPVQDAQVIEEKNYSVNVPDAQNPKLAEKLAEIAEKESPFKAERGSVEYLDGKITKVDGQPVDKGENIESGKFTEKGYSLKQLTEMDTKVLQEMVNTDTDMIEASEMIGGKNTNKKLREIIFAHQEGKLAQYVAPFLKPGIQDEQKTDENISASAINQGIQPNKDFDKQKSDKEIDDFLHAPSKTTATGGNKYNIQLPDFDKGQEREFSTLKKLYNQLASLTPPLNNPRYLEIGAKMGILEKFADREAFCRYATISEINALLNEN